MSEPTPASAAIPSAPASGGKKKGLLVIGLAAAVLIAGVGGGAYWWTHRGEPVAEAKAIETPERGLVTFEPFVVNLADANASRFLRANIQVVVATLEDGAKIKETPVAMMQARSIILELLTTQKSDELVTPDGKAALRKSIKERVQPALGQAEVIDVLFSDFVVQF